MTGPVRVSGHVLIPQGDHIPPLAADATVSWRAATVTGPDRTTRVGEVTAARVTAAGTGIEVIIRLDDPTVLTGPVEDRHWGVYVHAADPPRAYLVALNPARHRIPCQHDGCTALGRRLLRVRDDLPIYDAASYEIRCAEHREP